MTDVAPPGFQTNRFPMGAVLLILVGVIFLLNNYAVLPWNIWGEIARLWPILLIIWGAQLVFGRHWLVRLILSVVMVAAVGLVVIGNLAQNNSAVDGWLNRTWPHWRQSNLFGLNQSASARETFTVSLADYDSVTSRQMNFQIGIGQLTLADNGADDSHLTLAARYADDEKPTLEKTFSDGQLDISVRSSRLTRFFFPESSNWEWDGKIGQPSLLTAFNIDLGTGMLTADFRQQKISSMDINVGAGQATLRLSPAAVASEQVKARVGAGSLEIKTGKEVGLKVKYSTGIGNVAVGTLNLHGSGEYTSPDYDTAATKLTIDVNLGAGEVSIDRD